MRSSGCFLKSGVTGGFEPPLRVRWESGLAGRLIGDPYSALQNLGRLQNRTRHVGEALSLPKLTQLGGSMNVERLRRSGRLRAAPTRCGGNRELAGRQVGNPYVAYSIDNVFTHLQLMQSS